MAFREKPSVPRIKDDAVHRSVRHGTEVAVPVDNKQTTHFSAAHRSVELVLGESGVAGVEALQLEACDRLGADEGRIADVERRELGMGISWSAVLGAAARLRPILMTSLAMVVGLLPMMFASGVGKNGNQTLGAAAVGGMFIGTICQIVVVPALFVIFQSLQEKFRPMKFEDETDSEAAAELEQYAHGVVPEDYVVEE